MISSLRRWIRHRIERHHAAEIERLRREREAEMVVRVHLLSLNRPRILGDEQ